MHAFSLSLTLVGVLLVCSLKSVELKSVRNSYIASEKKSLEEVDFFGSKGTGKSGNLEVEAPANENIQMLDLLKELHDLEKKLLEVNSKAENRKLEERVPNIDQVVEKAHSHISVEVGYDDQDDLPATSNNESKNTNGKEKLTEKEKGLDAEKPVDKAHSHTSVVVVQNDSEDDKPSGGNDDEEKEEGNEVSQKELKLSVEYVDEVEEKPVQKAHSSANVQVDVGDNDNQDDNEENEDGNKKNTKKGLRTDKKSEEAKKELKKSRMNVEEKKNVEEEMNLIAKKELRTDKKSDMAKKELKKGRTGVEAKKNVEEETDLIAELQEAKKAHEPGKFNRLARRLELAEEALKKLNELQMEVKSEIKDMGEEDED